MNSIDEIYETLKASLTPEYLKQVCSGIINAYRKKNYGYLRKFAGNDESIRQSGGTRLFTKLMMKFHPDRHAFIMKEAARLYGGKDPDPLQSFYESYFPETGNSGTAFQQDVSFREIYGFGNEDFGYREENIYEMDDEEGDEYFFDDEPDGFYSALNRAYFGGLDNSFTESDLQNLDGDLDLSDFGIRTLNGIEKCIHLEELNLSDNLVEKTGCLSSLRELHTLFLSSNRIEDISSFEGLENLKILDISGNQIRNIDVLLNLRMLEYVNILGNPLENSNAVGQLIAKGVMVIFEENILV